MVPGKEKCFASVLIGKHGWDQVSVDTTVNCSNFPTLGVSMTIVMSAREFNQDTGGAKKAAQSGPVLITDRGEPTHVLLSIEEYRKLTGGAGSIVTQLAMADDVDFDVPKLAMRLKPASFE
jgi:prevent-host-death family protein